MVRPLRTDTYRPAVCDKGHKARIRLHGPRVVAEGLVTVSTAEYGNDRTGANTNEISNIVANGGGFLLVPLFVVVFGGWRRSATWRGALSFCARFFACFFF